MLTRTPSGPADLVRAFETASGQAGHPLDVQAWAKSWITRLDGSEKKCAA